jgi:deoxyribodipyrimidine photolyase
LLQAAAEAGASAVFFNHLYDPISLVRDHEVKGALRAAGVAAHTSNGDLLYEPWEVLDPKTSRPFTRFDEFWAAAQAMPRPPAFPLPPPPSLPPLPAALQAALPGLDPGSEVDWFFSPEQEATAEPLAHRWRPGPEGAAARLEEFCSERLPLFEHDRAKVDRESTSRLSPWIHFGSISVRYIYYRVRHAVADAAARAEQLERAAAAEGEGGGGGGGAQRRAGDDADDADGPATSSAAAVGAADEPSSVGGGGGGSGQRRRRAANGDERHATAAPRQPPQQPQNHQHRAAALAALAAARAARSGADALARSASDFLRQMAYREYARYLSYHFPYLHERSLLAHLRAVPWRVDRAALSAWRAGQTGYPLVDAGMRQLWSTGWVHNRLRVVCASFAVKHLLLPWQWGLKHYWDAFLDADLENDALGWQYVAGCMADAHPFAYMIDLEAEAVRFDPDGEFVRRWLPALARLPTRHVHAPWKAPAEVLEAAGVEIGLTYPRRIVLLEEARERVAGAVEVIERCCAAQAEQARVQAAQAAQAAAAGEGGRSEAAAAVAAAAAAERAGFGGAAPPGTATGPSSGRGGIAANSCDGPYRLATDPAVLSSSWAAAIRGGSGSVAAAAVAAAAAAPTTAEATVANGGAAAGVGALSEPGAVGVAEKGGDDAGQTQQHQQHGGSNTRFHGGGSGTVAAEAGAAPAAAAPAAPPPAAAVARGREHAASNDDGGQPQLRHLQQQQSTGSAAATVAGGCGVASGGGAASGSVASGIGGGVEAAAAHPAPTAEEEDPRAAKRLRAANDQQ